MKKMTLGFSSCPNDTFIFEALINGRVGLDIQFDVHMADVEELNQLALKGELDITKLSYNAYTYVADQYQLLNSGSALGRKCGPLLICRSDTEVDPERMAELTVAIPGKYTTANLLLGHAFPEVENKEEYLFSEIEDAVLSGRVDAGVIIHENRFTYQEKGLRKIADLGDHWESKTGYMIPLGGIAIKRDLPLEQKIRIDEALKASTEFAWQNGPVVMPYVAQYAQEMSEDVMMQHIKLYVNEYTADLGEEGKAAVKFLYETGEKLGITPSIDLQSLFVE